ncbi:hypothetical protein FQR65_LT10889 [Abscondita terminalis]|nr:hypothetical protein FQR65_LT10889 [Abscondita terminalis]
MKISVVCVCVFLFCTIYWAFGLSQILISAENAVPATTTSASVLLSDNYTSTSVSDSDGYQTVLHKQATDSENRADFINKEVLKSTTEDENKQEYAFVDILSQNSGLAHEVIGPSPGIIQTLVDSKLLEKTEVSNSADTITSHHNKTPHLENVSLEEKPLNINTLRSETDNNVSVEINMDQTENINSNASDNTQQTDNNGTEVPTAEPKSNATTEEVKTQEDIPSFSEWTQKQLEEAEKKKEEANSSAQNQQLNGKIGSNIRKRWKNYASPDCGAKIIAANPEANSAGSVLSASRDEYKLNACTNRIWFIVELCEAIQAKKIELANFELFSSSPKDFAIYVSDRFPTRDWLSVGQFTAKDERDIQSFDLDPHLFGKYIKFEMYSHHGSEHYCPISLFRVFGTSEFEVLETENQVNDNAAVEEDDEDDDESITVDGGAESSKNLFSSATDAVISIVKKAAEVLGNKGNVSSNGKVQENITTVKYSPLISTCTTPSHIVVCDNCSDLLFGNVFELLSCSSKELSVLVSQPIIKTVLYATDVCSPFGLEFCSKSTCSIPNPYKSYVSSLFPPKLIAALCNVVAVNECKVVRNISSNATNAVPSQTNDSKVLDTKIIDDLTLKEPTEILVDTLNIENIYNSATQQESSFTETLQIKPTKTLTSDIKHVSINVTPNIESSKNEDGVVPTDFPIANEVNDTVFIDQNKSASQQMEHIEVSSEVVSDVETTENAEHLDLDNLVTDLNEESANVASTTLSPPTLPQGQKESVFLRLSNRIKALERNMSLSSQYLEELSRRYKKQVEEMQRLLDKTINTFNEENKKKEERSQHLEEEIILLRESINSLIEDKKAWMNTTYWLFLSGVMLVGVLLFCRRNQEFNQSGDKSRTNTSQIWRRMSVDVITNKNPVKKRRPSEEASLISGTYSNLMIDDVDSNNKLKRRKRKKKGLQRSNSIPTLCEEAGDYCDNTNRTINSVKDFKFVPISSSCQIWRRQESAPPNVSNWVDDVTFIGDAPLTLEECDHSALDPLTYNNDFSKANENNINNGDIKSSTFIVTATDTRAKRFLQKHKGTISKVNEGHKKSLSFDESTRGTMSMSAATDTTSLTNSIDESTNKILELPKKEKKNTFKRLFKSINFK